MLFKDSDVERKFFQLFLFDDENDDDEDEEDNNNNNDVDKTLIKWTRAPKTVARARKEIVELTDDEEKNKLRIVSVSTPLRKMSPNPKPRAAGATGKSIAFRCD